MKPRNIFLTGFMGVGKSAVGLELAQQINWKLMDTDKKIVESAGMDIPELFSKRGEAGFRQIEKEVIAQVCAGAKQVVSLGGGALLDEESRSRVQQAGTLIYLSALTETLLKRLDRSRTPRPLLMGLDPEKKKQTIEEMHQKREPLYNEASLKIETDGKKVVQVVQEIIEALQFNL